ncbi:G-PROTEIN-RECEP-F1-2 domain-containing protein [Aphelenchoides besseyi]|nr:G-PROTEIN-RECEP-F1-2 domain-containing protein [Aphelenchoides besseyi]KAI6236420.1 G-PROTEIN-RECEP-F1-2 domain-containing protein [Aphelenchoides besseyi]
MSGFELQMNAPPEPIASDYIELGTLVTLWIIGAPLNLIIYTQLAERPICTRLDILKRHLNYSDLLVIFIYVPSRAAWLLTYDWRGGNFLCATLKMAHTLSFQISSNIIVVIAVDRLLTVISNSHHRPDRAHKRINIMLALAWAAAFVISAPQLAVWRTYEPYRNWSQCMQIWEISRAEAIFKNNTRINVNELMPGENLYVIIHMLLIFWLPAFIVMLSYIIVSVWVWLNSSPSLLMNGNPRGSESSRGISYHTGMETIDTVVTRTTGVQFATNPKIVISDEQHQPLNCDTRASSATSADILRHNSTTKVIMASALRSHSTFSVKVNRTRAIRVSLMLITTYVMCWLPYNALSLTQFFNSELFSKHANKLYAFHSLMVLNSVINPFLYMGNIGKNLCPTKSKRYS